MSRLVASTLVLIVAATACSSTADVSAVRTVDMGRTEVSTAAPRPGGRAAATFASQTWPDWALANFDDCDRLLDHIQTEALRRVGAYGLDRGQYQRSFDDDLFDEILEDDLENGFGDDMASRFARDVAEGDFESEEAEFESGMGGDDMGADDMGADDMGGEAMDDMGPQMDIAADAGGGDAGVEFSGTNVQVTGVDEPDIVKTDGRRIITVSKGVLTVVDVSGAEPTVAGHVVLDETPDGELLLHGDRILAIRNDAGGIRPEGKVDERGRTQPETVVIDEVLLDGTPRRGRTMRVEGRYVSSRSVGGTARIVINSFPEEPGFVRPLNRDGIPLAVELNRQVVEETTLSDWLPDYSLVNADGSVLEEGEPFLACDRVHVPGEFGGFGTASVLTVDLTQPLAPDDGAATFAVAETVYASLRNLYVATSAWVSASDLAGSEIAGRAAERYATSIHKFSFGTGGAAAYEASGAVDGHLLNQFAFHERGGHLFVAATDGPPGRFGGTVSRIVALGQRGDRLVEVGEVGDLGRGERIFAVRYIGDRAYVVTFRRVDPLYVVDLSDPTRLTVLGELKIPGFSSYLHPIGDGLLVGVGRDVTEWGSDRGLKISLFDVSDPAAPAEIDVWTRRYAHSDVGADHRSFLWWGRDQLMVLPVTVPYWGDGPSGAYAFTVTRSGGIEEFGQVDHGQEEPVRRSLVIGEDLWTMSATLLQRNDLGTFELGDRVPLPTRDELEPDRRSEPAESTTPAPAETTSGLERQRLRDQLEDHLSTVMRFADCPGLLGHIQTGAASHVGAFGFDRGRFGRLPDRSGDTGDAGARRLVVADDESLRDFIDTDGHRIVTTVEDTLTVVDVARAEPSVVGRLPLDLDRTTRVITHGNRVLVIGEKGADRPRSGESSEAGNFFNNAVVVREFLIDDEPRPGRSLYVEGRLLDARSGDGKALVVVRTTPKDLGLVYAATEAGERFATAGNRQSIGRSTLANWLPGYALVSNRGTVLAERQLLSCNEVVVPSEFSGVGVVSALTIDLNQSITSGAASAIFSEDVATLATDESLYVATEPWLAPSHSSNTGHDATAGLAEWTSIHRFSLSHWQRATYEASGAVPGNLLGSSPLHEYERQAYYESPQPYYPGFSQPYYSGFYLTLEGSSSPTRTYDGEQRIEHLWQEGNRLWSAGRVRVDIDLDGIGLDDPISDVRYSGHLAFALPARRGAPVRVVNLDGPEFGTELAALTDYDYRIVLRPIGADRLATVESDRSRWRPSTKVSSYAVVDGEFREIGTWTQTGTSSRAASDPQSLLWSDGPRLLVVPVAGRLNRAQTSGAAVFSVSPAGDLTYVGHVGPNEHRRADGGNEVFRSLTIGEDLWTLSASYSRLDRQANWLLQSYDLDTLERKTAVALND